MVNRVEQASAVVVNDHTYVSLSPSIFFPCFDDHFWVTTCTTAIALKFCLWATKSAIFNPRRAFLVCVCTCYHVFLPPRAINIQLKISAASVQYGIFSKNVSFQSYGVICGGYVLPAVKAAGLFQRLYMYYFQSPSISRLLRHKQ